MLCNIKKRGTLESKWDNHVGKSEKSVNAEVFL
jgi:hypothetical protein